METKDTLSSCSYSDEQDMQQMLKQAKILKGSCLNGLSALKSHFTQILEPGITKSEFERAFSHIFGENVIYVELQCHELRTTNTARALIPLRPNLGVLQLHSHLKLLSNNNLQETRTESGFKRAFATLFGQDIETFTGTMFLNVDQLEKQLDKDEFQEIGSMAAFKVLKTQFKMFIKSRMYMDDEYVKSIDERAKHKKEYNSWVNERQMQTTEDKVDSRKALDASLVDTESSGTALKEQDTSSRSGNDSHADDADIRPIYDEEPMAENAEQCHDTCPLPATLTDNQTTELSNQSLESENIPLKEGQHGQFLKVKSNEAKVKHDIDVIETINIELEHKVAKLLKENETLKRHYKEMFDSIKTTRAKNIEHTTSLIATNDKFKAQIQEKGFAVAALKNELRKLTGNSVNTKFTKPSILGKPVGQPLKNQSVVRQPTAFKSERPKISKPRFASQVDVNN
ncbi:hypothetical protein Tco_0810900 [Tanacetum coccineum]